MITVKLGEAEHTALGCLVDEAIAKWRAKRDQATGLERLARRAGLAKLEELRAKMLDFPKPEAER